MSIKKVYFYLFYKIYKFSEAAPSKWDSEWKAGLVMDVLVFCVVASLFILYTIFINRDIKLSKNNIEIMVLVSVVGVSNYFIFHHKDAWKYYVHEFDKWPRRKNIIGGIIAWTFIFSVFASLIFSFYLMSQINWIK